MEKRNRIDNSDEAAIERVRDSFEYPLGGDVDEEEGDGFNLLWEFVQNKRALDVIDSVIETLVPDDRWVAD